MLESATLSAATDFEDFSEHLLVAISSSALKSALLVKKIVVCIVLLMKCM